MREGRQRCVGLYTTGAGKIRFLDFVFGVFLANSKNRIGAVQVFLGFIFCQVSFTVRTFFDLVFSTFRRYFISQRASYYSRPFRRMPVRKAVIDCLCFLFLFLLNESP